MADVSFSVLRCDEGGFTGPMMTPEQVQAHFTDAEGAFRFARWQRPIVPMVLGVDEATLALVKGSIEAIVMLAGHKMAETDPEMGANFYMFFLRDWDEVAQVPQLDGLVPGIGGRVDHLKSTAANQFRMFRFEKNGALRAAFAFLRMDHALERLPADALALSQVFQMVLLWGEGAFAGSSPLAMANARAVLRPDMAALLQAAYDPVLPPSGTDPALALRIYARMEARHGT